MRGNRLRAAASLIAIMAALASLAVWWLDGAWDNGAMPTDGMIKVLAFACGGLLCLFVAGWLERRTERRQSGSQA